MVTVACKQVAKDGQAVALRPVTEVDLLTLYRWRRRFLPPPVAPRPRALLRLDRRRGDGDDVWEVALLIIC
jgi:hypothetical protein